MAVTYKPLSDSDWRDLPATRAPHPASCTVSGDLDNRSSLQFIDPGGIPDAKPERRAIAAFRAAFNK